MILVALFVTFWYVFYREIWSLIKRILHIRKKQGKEWCGDCDALRGGICMMFKKKIIKGKRIC